MGIHEVLSAVVRKKSLQRFSTRCNIVTFWLPGYDDLSFLCNASSVMRWRDARRRGGTKALKVRFSPGRPWKLKAAQRTVNPSAPSGAARAWLPNQSVGDVSYRRGSEPRVWSPLSPGPRRPISTTPEGGRTSVSGSNCSGVARRRSSANVARAIGLVSPVT
jgi:hypothetical protein